ncbi:MAG: NAD(P)H-dependent oxidoreductase subunit E [Chloroflexota bacterium]
MLGVFKGLRVIGEHLVRFPKLTRFYPFQKPELPERSRGLIQLTVEEETGTLKCEACRLCEKACPPRAITISYEQRDAFRPFRRRPAFRPKTISGFYRPRMVAACAYEGIRPLSKVVDVPRGEVVVADPALARLDAILTSPRAEEGLMPVLEDVQSAFGYLPRWAVEKVALEASIPVSDLYSMATLSPQFRLRPAVEGGAAGD